MVTQELVPKKELDATLQQLLIKEKGMLEAGEKLLAKLDEGQIRDSLSTYLQKTREFVTALENGFVPVILSGLIRVDTKDEWNKPRVRALLRTMPDEIKEAWDEADKTGLFKTFSVSIGGDPVLVGNAGGKPFLLGVWFCVPGGQRVGFRFRR